MWTRAGIPEDTSVESRRDAEKVDRVRRHMARHQENHDGRLNPGRDILVWSLLRSGQRSVVSGHDDFLTQLTRGS